MFHSETRTLIAKRSPWCKSLAGAIAVAAFVFAPTAWAANASDLTVTLTVKPSDTSGSSVSISRSGLPTYVAYKMLMLNSSTNTVNQVVLTATTTVLDGSTPTSNVAKYVTVVNLGASSPNCPSAPPTPTNSVVCQIGQLKSGESREFFLIFQTPLTGTSIHFNGSTNFSEGNSSNSPPANFTKTVTGDTTLTTTATQDVNSNVKTILPPVGGGFFTGANGKVDSTNAFSTSVSIQPSAYVTDNAIVEETGGGTYACATAYFCYGLFSSISVDDAKDDAKIYFTSPLITIILRQDVSSLSTKKPIPSIDSVKIFYSPTGELVDQALVPSCSVTPAYKDHPCVAARNDFLKGSKGYYEYVIQAFDNGKFGI
jgi:hypothetical protein